MRTTCAVPWGAEGFVVGVFGGETGEIEVVFDEPFLGGISLGGRARSSRGYRMPSSWLVCISHGLRAIGQPALRKPTPAEQAALRSLEATKAAEEAQKTAAAETETQHESNGDSAASSASVTMPPVGAAATGAKTKAQDANAAAGSSLLSMLKGAARPTLAPSPDTSASHTAPVAPVVPGVTKTQDKDKAKAKAKGKTGVAVTATAPSATPATSSTPAPATATATTTAASQAASGKRASPPLPAAAAQQAKAAAVTATPTASSSGGGRRAGSSGVAIGASSAAQAPGVLRVPAGPRESKQAGFRGRAERSKQVADAAGQAAAFTRALSTQVCLRRNDQS